MATWFRCYSDIADNYKLKMLAYEDRWHYIALLSCKSLGMLDGKRPEFVFRTVAMRLGLTTTELEEVARRLAEYHLIEQKTLQPVGWDERQFVSDNSTERSRKCRINKKTSNVAATPMQRNCNGPDTDTDTDTDIHVASRLTTCPHQEILALFADELPELPQPKVWEGSRAKDLSARWKWVLDHLKKKGKPQTKDEGLEFFRRMFAYIRDSDFLMGKASSWSCDIGWIMKANNFAKIIEGNYHKEVA